MFERHIQEVTAAAGRVQNADGGEAGQKPDQFGAGFFGLVFFQLAGSGGLCGGPFAAQRFQHRGQHQPLHVAARGVVGTQAVAFAGVEGAFEQGAENGGFHGGPVGFGGAEQQLHLVGGEGQGRHVVKEFTVEAPQPRLQIRRKPAGVHRVPEQFEGVGQVLAHGLGGVGAQHAREGFLGNEAHVFGKHGEEAAHQKLRHAVGGMTWLARPALFQLCREISQIAR